MASRRQCGLTSPAALRRQRHDAEAARQQWHHVADQIRPKVPKLATVLEQAESDVLAYMRFLAAHRAPAFVARKSERCRRWPR